MLTQKIYDTEEINNIIFYAQSNGNLQGVVEAKDHNRYFGKTVTIVKGRKNKGFTGVVFWLSRQNYSNNPWTGWKTRIGIKNENNEVVWSNTDNIELSL
jgi:hypothetical protein